MSVVAAVNSDLYGGLSGYKRPVQGNPTRVPGNQPAFRGVTNKPGQPIKTPAIKSSANHPDRKTNVLIPYARVTPVELPADLGRTDPGDVLFVSKTRPGVPGYAHARESRVCGLDALNRWLSPMHWNLKNEAGEFRYILNDPIKVADDWRKVPLLQEWTIDGICLSNDERNLYRGSMQSQRDGQLWNVGIQGPCMINNGYVEEHSAQNGLIWAQQGQVARTNKLFAPGYMDHRVERFGQDKVQVDQSWDFAADYAGPQYHLYPLQMFSREVRPMQELYAGLVATEYKLTPEDVNLMKQLAAAETALDTAETSLAGESQNPGLVVALRAAKKNLRAIKRKPNFKRAFTAKTAYDKMGWWDSTLSDLKDVNSSGDTRPKSFVAFRYVLFTSAQAWLLASEDEIGTMAAEGEPKMAKRQKVANDPFDNEAKRIEDFKHMVGAWHIGKVLDMKAGKMPYFEGGPVETGYRLTVNLNLEWRDWRALRREYTPPGSSVQICSAHEPKWEGEESEIAGDEARERTTLFQWPTLYDAAAEKLANDGADGTTPNAETAFRKNPNVPVSMDDYGSRRSDDVYKFDFNEYVEKQRVAYQQTYYKKQTVVDQGDLPAPEQFNPEGFEPAVFEARLAKLPEMPRLTGGESAGEHVRAAQIGIARLEALLAPVTASERAGNGPSIDIANFVVAAPSAPTAAAPIRRRAGNTPEPSPDRTGAVGAVGTVGAPADVANPTNATATGASTSSGSLPPVIEAPSAPQASGGKKRRSAAASSDVFSSIFGSGGETGAAPQPLNPAHRSDGASGASTGRSYQRRGGKGGSGNKE